MKPGEKKKLSSAELSDRNHFLETLINLSPGILYIYDIVEKKNVYSNEGIQTILGYSVQEIKDLGSGMISLLMHPDDLKTYIQEILPKYATAQDGEQLITQYRVQHKDGTWRWVKSRESIYLRMPDGTPQQIVGMIEDITEHKQAKVALKESEEKFRALYENAPLSYQSLNQDGSFEDVNPAWLRTLGYERDEIIGKFYKDFLHPDWVSHFEKSFPKFKKNGYVSDVQFKIRHKDGHYLDISFEGCIGYHPDGSFRQTYCVFADITEKKKVEQELLESEARFKALHNASFGGIAIHDKGVILECNQGLIDITGYSMNELIGMDGLLLIAKKERKEVMRRIISGYEKPYESIGLRKNGEKFAVRLEGRNVPYKGKILRNVEFRDITEQKQAEEMIENQAAKWQTTFNAMSDSVCIVDLEGNILQCNSATLSLLNVDEEIVNQKKCFEIVHGTKSFFNNCPLVRMQKTLKPESMIFSEGALWLEVNVDPIFNSKDELIGAVHVVSDITERKHNELELAAEKERLAITLRSIGDGVITTDSNGKITMLNKVAEKLTGWDAAEATGNSLPEVFNVVNEITRKQCLNSASKVLETGDIVELANHTCLIAKDGRETEIADSAAPIHDSDNNIIGVVLVFRDMSEKYKLDETRQKAQKLESLGILAGGIAHDFNNILTGVFGNIEMAMIKTADGKVLNYLKESLGSIDRASALTQQLLTFAKGGTPVKKVESLFPFVQKAAQFVLSGSSVSSKFKIQDNLWSSYFDKNQIGQVIDNLTINAQQAMPNGGKIEFSAQNVILSENEHVSLARGNYVKLAIKDEGIGIPKGFLPSIFDPYFTTKSKGHGLGLATCYSIVKRHGGAIEIESELGKGSTFYLYLPAATESTPASKGRSVEEHVGTGTFLVMDDEAAIREIMKEALESFGYTVVLKENGKDAIDFFAAEIKANRKIAGMIFDLTIPGGMGGKEAIGEIRKLSLDTPAFVASGYSVDPVMADPAKYGFTASIPKPFRIAELSKFLDKYIK